MNTLLASVAQKTLHRGDTRFKIRVRDIER